jgi:hypothetical protein
MISKEEMGLLVAAWDAAPDATHDPRVKTMIHHEVARIEGAFKKLPVQVQFVDHDPYKSFEEMRDQVRTTGTMLVYKGASETPLWTPQTNWKARAVHDWDHIVHSVDFSMEGEAAAYRHSASRVPELAPLYLSEIMLQAAIQNYTGNFVPQKLVIAPEAIQKKARGMSGVPTENAGAADTVWFVAGMLRAARPIEIMLHLRAMGYGREQSLIILDAARMLQTQRV